MVTGSGTFSEFPVTGVDSKGDKWPRYRRWLLSARSSHSSRRNLSELFAPFSYPLDRRPRRDRKAACVCVHGASHVYPPKGNLCSVNNLSSLVDERSCNFFTIPSPGSFVTKSQVRGGATFTFHRRHSTGRLYLPSRDRGSRAFRENRGNGT